MGWAVWSGAVDHTCLAFPNLRVSVFEGGGRWVEKTKQSRFQPQQRASYFALPQTDFAGVCFQFEVDVGGSFFSEI